MSRVNYHQSAFNSQKEKLNILAEMLKISLSGCAADLHIYNTVTIRAPVGAKKNTQPNFFPQRNKPFWKRCNQTLVLLVSVTARLSILDPDGNSPNKAFFTGHFK